METSRLENPWPNVPFSSTGAAHSKETVNSVNAYLLRLAFQAAEEHIKQTKIGNGSKSFEKFKVQAEELEKFAAFFNPSWKK